MKEKGKRILRKGVLFLGLFVIWTVLVQTIDVQCAGETGREVGFAAMNLWFHQQTGVHMGIYTVTDWLGLVPIAVCLVFGMIGAGQWIKRKSLRKVDRDIILLGMYYVLVILCYLIFEMVPVNYRPIFIEGRLEASYPSSTTLLVLSVMPTLVLQADRRMKTAKIKNVIRILAIFFSVFMVSGRILSGVHWFTDIAGGILLSHGLFCIYHAVVLLWDQEEN